MRKGQLLILGLVSIIILGAIVQTKTSLKGNASNPEMEEVVSEELLLQKDNILSEILLYSEGLNPYTAKGKISVLSNVHMDKLKLIKDKSYMIYITDDRTNENLPEPVKVYNHIIFISIYSEDADIIDKVNKIK